MCALRAARKRRRRTGCLLVTTATSTFIRNKPQGTETRRGSKLIKDVKVKKLNVIPDERGRLTEILRSDDSEFFTKFGQVYVSTTYPDVVKAWHYHKVQIDNFVCVA